MQAASETFTKPDPAVKPGDLAVVVGAGVSGVAAARLCGMPLSSFRYRAAGYERGAKEQD